MILISIQFNCYIKNVTRSVLNVRDHTLIPQTWSKGEKTTIKPKNEQDKCCQYAATAALNHEEVKKDQQMHQKLKIFINKYNWKGKVDPSKINDS